MGGKDKLELQGIVLETLPGTQFKVKVDDPNYPNYVVIATISGKMRMNYIKILPGDRVNLEVSIYDLTKGRITYRHKEVKKTESFTN